MRGLHVWRKEANSFLFFLTHFNLTTGTTLWISGETVLATIKSLTSQTQRHDFDIFIYDKPLEGEGVPGGTYDVQVK